MQKRLRKSNQPRDINQAAHAMVTRSTMDADSPPELNRTEILRFMREMGSKGGKKGGKARAAKLTPEERSASASLAARARWARAKKR
jgi:hypothetical protein